MQPSPTPPSLVWFRDDLRLADNPALTAASERNAPAIALFVLDDDETVTRPRGGASRRWLHHSLTSLAADLGEIGVPLVLRRGASESTIADLVEKTGAGAIFWNRRYGPGERGQDARIKQRWRGEGLEVRSFDGTLLHEPWEVVKSDGTPYEVYSAFWRASRERGEPRDPLPVPARLNGLDAVIDSDSLDDWGLLPQRPDWSAGLAEEWTPGAAGAAQRVTDFRDGLDAYGAHRDEPALDATSRLSPHLRFGEVSPHQLWHAIIRGGSGPAVDRFAGELGWREFNYNLLFHHEDLAEKNLRSAFDRMPWAPPSDETLGRWERGETGFPLVDAGMRQLWTSGWMHNRVRMVTASFLIKNLHIDWRLGEQWFWDTLVDADPANNSANWQWVAGSGVDAAPFFRVFNPVTQSRKFDPTGEYIKRWVPELRELDARSIHEPWDALGADGYAVPVTDLAESRREALEAFKSISER